jgi:hypothetical protein
MNSFNSCTILFLLHFTYNGALSLFYLRTDFLTDVYIWAMRSAGADNKLSRKEIRLALVENILACNKKEQNLNLSEVLETLRLIQFEAEAKILHL